MSGADFLFMQELFGKEWGNFSGYHLLRQRRGVSIDFPSRWAPVVEDEFGGGRHELGEDKDEQSG